MSISRIRRSSRNSGVRFFLTRTAVSTITYLGGFSEKIIFFILKEKKNFFFVYRVECQVV